MSSNGARGKTSSANHEEITVWSFKEGQTSDHHNYDLSGSEELVALRGVFLFSIYYRDRPKYPTRTRWTRFFLLVGFDSKLIILVSFLSFLSFRSFRSFQSFQSFQALALRGFLLELIGLSLT